MYKVVRYRWFADKNYSKTAINRRICEFVMSVDHKRDQSTIVVLKGRYKSYTIQLKLQAHLHNDLLLVRHYVIKVDLQTLHMLDNEYHFA